MVDWGRNCDSLFGKGTTTTATKYILTAMRGDDAMEPAIGLHVVTSITP